MAMKKPLRWIIEDSIGMAAVSLLAIIPVLESFIRFFFHRGIPFSQGTVSYLLLVTGCVSGMITTRSKDHLSIGLIHYIKNDKAKKILAVLTNILSSYTALILVFCSIVYIKIALNPPAMIGFIPDRVFALAMPVCFAIMSFRFASAVPLKNHARLIVFLPLIAGLISSLPLIAKFIWEFDIPEAAINLNDLFISIANVVKIPAIIILVLLAFAGTPLFIILGALAMLLFESSAWEVDTLAVNISTVLTTNDFIAIPLFTLTGFFLSESKAGERLVETFKAFFGWFPGGVIVVSILICAFFTTFTGASGVTILALGGILFTILSENARYPAKFSIGLLASSGSIGLLFPPSLPIILVAITMQQSVKKFFAGGILPGVLLTIAMIIFGVVVSIKTKIPLERFNLKKALFSLKNSIFEIFLPIILVAGFFSGILSLVEIGAAAFVYIVIIEVFVIRDIKLTEIPRVFARALPIIGGILSILALSKGLSEYVVFTQAPENFARWLQQTVSSKILFLLLLNGALLVTGCLMDIFSATVVVLPLIAPFATVYGIDPVHLGIIFLINLEAGYLTPPVGLNLFLASYRFKRPFVEICRTVIPFLAIQLVIVLLVTYIPSLSTFLPQFF